MKKILVLAAALALAASSCAFALPLVLTEPQKSGGPGVFDTFAARVSAPEQDFTKEELTLDELSTILWAATGQNGTESWTVPVIMGRDPNVSVYVMLKDGGYLLQLGEERADGNQQRQARAAPHGQRGLREERALPSDFRRPRRNQHERHKPRSLRARCRRTRRSRRRRSASTRAFNGRSFNRSAIERR